MDYSRMLDYHRENKAEVTLATIPVGPDEVARFGVVDVGATGEVQGFLEKPATTSFRSPFNPDKVEASMGVYIFNTELSSVSPVFNLYDKSWPIRTRVRQYPPAKFVFGEPGRTGMAMNSIITAGVIISGGTVSNSVLSQDVRVNSYTEIDASIIFSHVQIGRHCRIRRAIIDRDVHIPEGTVIGYDPVEDKRRYLVTPSGLTIVTRDASLFENPVAPEVGDSY